MDINTFTKIADEEAALLPEEFYKELSGGIIVSERACIADGAVADDLYTLGVYKIDALGRQIVLYYGSFEKLFRHMDEEQYRAKIREVIRHEFRHHLEDLSGIHGSKSLEAEDERNYRRYLASRTR